MGKKALLDKLIKAIQQDSTIVSEKDKLEVTLGSDPRWLQHLGLEKRDLIRLERKGLAIKARYVINKTKEHRVRWIILNTAVEVLNG